MNKRYKRKMLAQLVDGAVMAILLLLLLGAAHEVRSDEITCETGCESACVGFWGDWGQ